MEIGTIWHNKILNQHILKNVQTYELRISVFHKFFFFWLTLVREKKKHFRKNWRKVFQSVTKLKIHKLLLKPKSHNSHPFTCCLMFYTWFNLVTFYQTAFINSTLFINAAPFVTTRVPARRPFMPMKLLMLTGSFVAGQDSVYIHMCWHMCGDAWSNVHKRWVPFTMTFIKAMWQNLINTANQHQMVGKRRQVMASLAFNTL